MSRRRWAVSDSRQGSPEDDEKSLLSFGSVLLYTNLHRAKSKAATRLRRMRERKPSAGWTHPQLPRREALRIGAMGLLGLGLADLLRLESQANAGDNTSTPGSVIYLFQSGGPAQHETFDLKPDAPSAVRGEFNPIET